MVENLVIIENLMRNQLGKYECMAENSLGSGSSVTLLAESGERWLGWPDCVDLTTAAPGPQLWFVICATGILLAVAAAATLLSFTSWLYPLPPRPSPIQRPAAVKPATGTHVG